MLVKALLDHDMNVWIGNQSVHSKWKAPQTVPLCHQNGPVLLESLVIL